MRTPCLAVTVAAALLVPALAGAAPADRNRSGIPDSWERKHRLSIVKGQAAKDPDRDGLDNLAEYESGTHPRRRDSDGDGRPDGREDGDADGLTNRAEDATGNDPDRADTDGDGIKDGREAGRVVGARPGRVSIRLGLRDRLLRADLDPAVLLQCATAADWRSGVDASPVEDEPIEEEPVGPDDDDGVGLRVLDGLPAEVVDPLEELFSDEGLLAEDPEPGDEEGDDGPIEPNELPCRAGALKAGAWVNDLVLEDGVVVELRLAVP